MSQLNAADMIIVSTATCTAYASTAHEQAGSTDRLPDALLLLHLETTTPRSIHPSLLFVLAQSIAWQQQPIVPTVMTSAASHPQQVCFTVVGSGYRPTGLSQEHGHRHRWLTNQASLTDSCCYSDHSCASDYSRTYYSMRFTACLQAQLGSIAYTAYPRHFFSTLG